MNHSISDLKLDIKSLCEIDLSRFNIYSHQSFKDYFFLPPSGGNQFNSENQKIGEHYRLLVHISNLVDNKTILDIGTSQGMSAVALASNPTNTVITYDVEKHPDQDIRCPNVIFRIANVLDAHASIRESSIIFCDAMKDGVLEKELIKILLNMKWKGLLIFDDIHFREPFISFWKNLDLPKHDITQFGHITGTGIIIFNDSLYETLTTPQN